MTTTPWFLQVLGLPPYADRSAVRRAYAQSLRQIDPVADPQAFEHLRSAYEAARRWCEQADIPGEATHADDLPPTDPNESTGSSVADSDAADQPETESGPLDETEARAEVAALLERFVESARRADASQAVDLLEHTVATLRQRYIDAPGELEERLILLLASQELPHRAALFVAATRLFHWDDIGQLSPLGGAGAWVEAVIGEHGVWMRLSTQRRRHWLDIIGHATLPFPAALVGYWPDVERLCELYPLWIGLHLDNRLRDAWEAAFRALPQPQQATHHRKATNVVAFHPEPEKQPTKRRFSRRNVIILMALWGVMHLGPAILNYARSFSWPFSGDDTQATCVDLYRHMSRAHVFDGLSDEQIDELKTRAMRCERNGYWHPPTADDAP